MITNSFPMSPISSGGENYFFTSDTSITLEAGTYFAFLIGGGGGGYGKGGSYSGGGKGASAGSCTCVFSITETTEFTCTVGKGGGSTIISILDSFTSITTNWQDTNPGGASKIACSSFTVTAYGGQAILYKGANNWSEGNGGSYGLSPVGTPQVLIIGTTGANYVQTTSDTTYNGGITYKDVLYGAGGPYVSPRNGMQGCIFIQKI